MSAATASTQRADAQSAFEQDSFAQLLERPEWLTLVLSGRIAAFRRGSVLMYEHEPGNRVMVVLEGRVKVARAGAGGQEVLMSIRGPGEILGELALIGGQPRLASVIALEPVQVLAVEAGAFRRCLDANPRTARALLRVLSNRFADAMLERTQHYSSDTVARIAARLVELADRYGERTDRGILIALPLSQEELGGWVGASHAGVAKALQVLRELGWITTSRRRITVCDVDALRRRAA